MDRREIMTALRAKMRSAGIDAYIVGCGDFHGSEYYSEHFETLRFLSGFTGDSTTVAVTADRAGLWTDGRYHLQAEKELAGTDIELFKAGLPGVTSLTEFLKREMPEGGVLGFDGRVIPIRQAEAWASALAEKKISLKSDRDLVGELWTDRPALAFHDAFLLPAEVTGEDTAFKLARVRFAMAEKKADRHILTSLDDIAWLLNVRGSDVECNPVVLSFLDITADRAVWYAAEDVINEEVQAAVRARGVELKPYADIWEDVKTIPAGTKLLLDDAKACYYIKGVLQDGVDVIYAMNPSTAMKCKKNEAEMAALRRSHYRDGLAMTKFLYTLYHQPDITKWSEIDAANCLDGYRREQGAFELSFPTISAMGSNAAMAHYSATPACFSMLEKKGFLLVDSGGQYTDGTTDITRTMALGELTEEQKKMYTAVLRSNLRLAAARFPEGVTGYHLDVLARQPLWDLHLDYRHGTGHGVGFCLNVHEGPNSFRTFLPPDRNRIPALEPGMVTTDEPGYYLDGGYGIRIENELLCVEDEVSHYGRFLKFEVLTLCPIDLTPVIKEDLLPAELEALNNYHEWVYQTLKDGLTAEEAAWLRSVTLPL